MNFKLDLKSDTFSVLLIVYNSTFKHVRIVYYTFLRHLYYWKFRISITKQDWILNPTLFQYCC